MHTPNIQKLALTIPETEAVLGIKRTSVYSLIKQKRLIVCRINRRTLITADSIHKLVESATNSAGGL